MSEIQDTIVAKSRTGSGKGFARKLRSQGQTPAIVYGAGREPALLSVGARELVRTRKEFGKSHIYSIAIDGADAFKALIREIQVDAVTREVQHVDFWALDLTKPVTMKVALQTEGRPKGVVAGGVFSQACREVTLTGLPEVVPDIISLDVSGLEAGDVYRLTDIPLPEGVTFESTEDNFVVASVSELKVAT